MGADSSTDGAGFARFFLDARVPCPWAGVQVYMLMYFRQITRRQEARFFSLATRQ